MGGGGGGTDGESLLANAAPPPLSNAAPSPLANGGGGEASHEISEWSGSLSEQELDLLTRCQNGTERVILCSVWLRERINMAMDDGLLKTGENSLKSF